MGASFAGRLKTATLMLLSSLPAGCRNSSDTEPTAPAAPLSAGAVVEVSRFERSNDALARQIEFKKSLRGIDQSFQYELLRRTEGEEAPMSENDKLKRITLVEKVQELVTAASPEEKNDLASDLLDSVHRLKQLYLQLLNKQPAAQRDNNLIERIELLVEYTELLQGLNQTLGGISSNDLARLGSQLNYRKEEAIRSTEGTP